MSAKPEDFGIADEDMDSQKRTEQTSSANQGSTQNAAAAGFVDPDNKLLGGVAAGLAAYFGWDITLVRILMIILVFVPYCPDDYTLYIIGWIIIPEARTAAEKLSMRGEAVTIENIGKTVTDFRTCSGRS